MSEPQQAPKSDPSAQVPKPPRRTMLARLAGGAVVGALVFAAGLAGGWVAAKQKTSHLGTSLSEHGEGEPEGETSHAEAPVLPERTLANLGVEVAEIALTEFVRTRDVPAVVALPPGSRRPVSSPVAGVVRRVLAAQGQVVRAGDPVAEILRDPFPRPVLSLAEAMLKPLNEDHHRTVAELRSSAQALSIVREELARIRRILGSAGGSGASLPGKTEVDLVYEERRSLRSLENARAEARSHGLTDVEIAALEAGGSVPSDLPLARRVLERSRLWSADATAALEALPENVRGLPYATAVLGELVGTHSLAPEFVRALQERPALSFAFLEIAGLLQQGWSTPGVLALEAAGGLDPVVTVRVTADAPDWDVLSVSVRPGNRVDAGTPLAEVADLRAMHLRLAPAGPDLAATGGALLAREPVAAEPLVPGSGPSFAGLPLVSLDPGEGGASHGSAIVEAKNEVLAEASAASGARLRTWKLREGLRYLVHVPVERLAGRFVLPADAVIPRGPDSVVILKEGRTFREVPVRVEHLDARIAVVANDGAIFSGDSVVLRGAYALSLALRAAAGGAPADPHAGHNH